MRKEIKQLMKRIGMREAQVAKRVFSVPATGPTVQEIKRLERQVDRLRARLTQFTGRVLQTG